MHSSSKTKEAKGKEAKKEEKEELTTAYCNTMGNDISVIESCEGDSVCIRKEVMKCMKKEHYVCDKDFDKGKSVNKILEDFGFVIQMIIATQHMDFTTLDSITNADYIRAETPEGYPFIIYLDSKGYVETEGCVTEMTVLQDKRFVTESLLKACYKICVPAVRGVAIFTPNGISVAMYNMKMEMIEYNHSYMHIEERNNATLEVAVPYPIIPLSEVLFKPLAVEKRIKFVLDPLRKLILERTSKTMREIEASAEKIPVNLAHLNESLFHKVEKLEESITHLRTIYKENEKFSCKHSKREDEANECDCMEKKKEAQKMTVYNLAMRERGFNEMLALYSALAMKLKVTHSILEDIDFAMQILDDRFVDFDSIMHDPCEEEK